MPKKSPRKNKMTILELKAMNKVAIAAGSLVGRVIFARERFQHRYCTILCLVKPGWVDGTLRICRVRGRKSALLPDNSVHLDEETVRHSLQAPVWTSFLSARWRF